VIIKDWKIEVPDTTTPVYLAAIGDIHAESELCSYKILKQDIQWIKDNNAWWIGMGDYADALSMDDPRFQVDEVENSNRGVPDYRRWPAVVSKLGNLLDPIKDRCLGLLEGNHERSLAKYKGIHLHYNLCQRLMPVADLSLREYHPLDLSYRSAGRLKFVREGGSSSVLSVWMWHGNGSAQTREGRLRIMKKKAESFAADLYLTGHWHDLDLEKDITRTALSRKGSLEIVAEERFFGMTGCYLLSMKAGSKSYADIPAYPACEIGCLKMEILPFAPHSKNRRKITIKKVED
jgi:hypothetical protein